MLKKQEFANERDLVVLNHHHLPKNICNKKNAWKVKLANKKDF